MGMVLIGEMMVVNVDENMVVNVELMDGLGNGCEHGGYH